MDAVRQVAGDQGVHRYSDPVGRGQRGMVTAEMAVATLAALTIMIMLCWGIFVVVLQLRCVDTAAEVARQAARDDHESVRRAERDAPVGSKISIATRGGATTVEVQLDARPWIPGLPTVPLEAHAQVINEPDAP